MPILNNIELTKKANIYFDGKVTSRSFIDKEENYSIDITCELNGKTHYFEVECKVGYEFTCQNDC